MMGKKIVSIIENKKRKSTIISIVLVLILLFAISKAVYPSMPDRYTNEIVYKDVLALSKDITKVIKTDDIHSKQNIMLFQIKYEDDIKGAHTSTDVFVLKGILSGEIIPDKLTINTRILKLKTTLFGGIKKNKTILTNEEKEIIRQGYDVVQWLGLYLQSNDKNTNIKGIDNDNIWADNLMDSLEEFVTLSGIPIDL